MIYAASRVRYLPSVRQAARKELQETVAERKAAAIKVQAVRRGQQGRRDIAGLRAPIAVEAD